MSPVSCGVAIATHRFLSKVEMRFSRLSNLNRYKYFCLAESEMAGAKLIVIYPRPRDIESFAHV